jgi:hypothetical protein
MKQWTALLVRFALGVLVGGGMLLVFYCLTLPAKPFVYVGF